MSRALFISGNRVVPVSTHVSCSLFLLRFKFDLMCLTKSGLEYYLLQLAVSIYPTCTFLCIAALIPLAEFSDVTRTYGVSPDKETIEILTQVANQRGVCVVARSIHAFSVLNSF